MGVAGSASNGFLVNKEGYIEIPLLGRFYLAGLTTIQAEDSISKRASLYYKLPTVYVRFANFKVTVLGEVLRPGSYIVPNEKATIFDALGYAGDLTIFAKRENALLIRDSGNQTRLVRLNLNSKDIVKSDYFYLKQNDVIYVEPTKAKLANLDAVQNKNYAIIGAILSVLIIAGTRLK
jgi:polysaccharide export outer membrane protein